MDINNFRVSPVGDGLELWVEVQDGPNYQNIKIKSIAIQDHKHYTVGYPDTPQVELTTTASLDEFKINNQKKVIKRLLFKDMSLLGLNDTGLFFMYVKQEGIALPDTPCCCNKDITIAVACNLYPVYNQSVKLLNDYSKHCYDNKDTLIDIYLKKQMFLEAVSLQDYTTAISIYDSILFREVQSGDCLNACSYNNYSSQGVVSIGGGCKTCN